MRVLMIASLSFITLQTMAQGLSGKIVTENQQPVSFVNIAVLSANVLSPMESHFFMGY